MRFSEIIKALKELSGINSPEQKKLYSHVFQGMGFMEINDYNVLKAEAEQFLNSEVEK